ncbi:MAG: hypothetical protein V4671_18985 [Armatimonadota bacterium]
MQNSQVSLLLVGLHNSGKTHYGAQLLGRLRSGSGQLRMNGVARDLGPFEQALSDIAEGRLAQHTVTEMYSESVWPTVSQVGGQAELVWPDYGGEQVRQLYQRRRVGESWQRRIRHADGWVFFIRPQTIANRQDVWQRPGDKHDKAGTQQESLQWRDQASLIELLQILLYTRRADLHTPLQDPALVIALTCWDELSTDLKKRKPGDVLKKHLPLLASFIESNWLAERRVIYGVSALGKELQADSSDEDFQNFGAAAQGWVITPEGKQENDLTLPIAKLIELTTPL